MSCRYKRVQFPLFQDNCPNCVQVPQDWHPQRDEGRAGLMTDKCVVCCAEGAVTKRQWPGCLPTGTGKREGCVSSARAVCKCVDIGGKRGVGETWRPPTRRLLSAQNLPLHSHSLRVLVQAHTAPTTPVPSSCLGPRGPSATWHAPWVGVPHSDGLLDDVTYELIPQRVGPKALHVGPLHGGGLQGHRPLLVAH